MNKILSIITKVLQSLQAAKDAYTTADLVSFGNYLLSDERNASVREQVKGEVTDADLDKWKAGK